MESFTDSDGDSDKEVTVEFLQFKSFFIRMKRVAHRQLHGLIFFGFMNNLFATDGLLPSAFSTVTQYERIGIEPLFIH